jgi:hypothetical protein
MLAMASCRGPCWEELAPGSDCGIGGDGGDVSVGCGGGDEGGESGGDGGGDTLAAGAGGMGMPPQSQ